MYYILDENNNAKRVKSCLVWAKWFESNDRILEQTILKNMNDEEIMISTAFIGISLEGILPAFKPYLWETIVFGGKYDQYMKRSNSHEDALEAHHKIVKKVKLTI